MSLSDGVKVKGIRGEIGLPWRYKNQVEHSRTVFAHALLRVPVGSGKSRIRFWRLAKTVCFWQRLKQLKTEKTFAGQGAY